MKSRRRAILSAERLAGLSVAERSGPEKPAGASLPARVAERLVDGVTRGDFYILCQDNETTREQDERRILWAAGDIVENRPALSRRDQRIKDAFETFMKTGRGADRRS